MADDTKNAMGIITEVMRLTKTQQNQLSIRCGYKNKQNVHDLLRQSDMKTGTFAHLLNAMGYEVVVRPIKQGKRGADSFVVTPEPARRKMKEPEQPAE